MDATSIIPEMESEPAPEQTARPSVEPISCGCCRNGCCCRNHMDIPRGYRPRRCAVHSATGIAYFLMA